MVVVKADSPYKTLKDFIDAAKESPGTDEAVRRLDHRAATTSIRQLLMKQTGANWAFISFPGGGERIAALLGGHVNMMVIEPQEAGEHIRARQHARDRAGHRQAAAGVPERADAEGGRIRRARSCRRCAASSRRPGCPPTRSPTTKTSSRASSKTATLEEVSRRQPVRGRLPCEARSSRKFFDEFTDRMREHPQGSRRESRRDSR